MLRFLAPLIWVAAFSNVHAQKQDNVWLFGYDYNPGGLKEGIRFRFDDSLVISYEERPMDFATTSACISDSFGELLLYSNGCYIENVNGIKVQGSTGLNPGILYDLYCADDIGYNIPQDMIILPDPTNITKIHLFHFPLVTNTSENLLHTIVDLSTNNGQGSTILKNQPVVFDTISPDGLHAVRHANGRDWWIIATKYKSNKYYILLLSPEGISSKEQIIGEPALAGAGGQFVFSPDGAKVARFNTKDDLRIFDFDRCTGTLSNPVFIPVQDDADNNLFAGLAWSADGHYLYAAEIKRLLQFDMWASDIAASKIIVAERDPVYCCPYEIYLAYLELGPDGYIYGNSLGGQNFMNRIKYPERGGMGCEVQKSYYNLDFPYANLPHFPNFRLGPIDGSVCDTLGIDNHPLAGWRYDHTSGAGVDFTSVSWYEPTDWLWDFGDGTQSSERNPAHTFPGPGAYEVCLQVSNQYGSDVKCKTVWISTTGLPPAPSVGGGVVLFPNPTTGVLQWIGIENEPVLLRVFNALGQLQVERAVESSQTDLSMLDEGLYFVQLLSQQDKTLLASQKLMITKH